MEEGSNDCRYGSGDIIDVADPEVVHKLLTQDCIIEEGAIMRMYYEDDPRPSQAVYRKPEAKKDKKMEPSATDTPPIAAPPIAAPPQLTVPAAPPAAPAADQGPVLVPSTAPAPAAPFDVSSLVSATGGSGSIAVILALIAVVGGTAAWKFWQKLSEQKHEQAMKRMELEAEANSARIQNQGQHPQCVSANAALEAKLATLDAKLAALDSKIESVESKSTSFSAGFDPDDLTDRLGKIEKKVKALSAKPHSKSDNKKD